MNSKKSTKMSVRQKPASPSNNFSEALRFGRRLSPYAFVAGAGIWLPKADAATLVNLDVTSTNNYAIGSAAATITNTGSLVGDFISAGAIVPGISNIDGVGAVAMLDVAG